MAKRRKVKGIRKYKDTTQRNMRGNKTQGIGNSNYKAITQRTMKGNKTQGKGDW